jgi:DNA-binding SARP family transcriptional activator
LLGALLVDASRPLSADHLAERVWGQSPPSRARDSIYSYLSRLRAALRSAGDVALARQPGGYRLSVDPRSLDLNQFRALVGQARGCDDEQAVLLLTRALSLWRDEPLAGLDTPWCNTVRATLHQERLEAELSRNDATLRLGGHSALLAVLHGQTEAHPLDERLAGQLMLALYRSGRPGAALAEYQRVRQSLVRELGTEPGTALRQMQQRMLAGDPMLAWPVAPSWLTPRQLPPGPRVFVGRARELASLTDTLSRPARRAAAVPISIVTGPGGIGKSALALRWAQLNKARFPDGQLYVNLRGSDRYEQPLTSSAGLRSLLKGLGVPYDALSADPDALGADADAQAGLYRSIVAGKRTLVLLDDAANAAQVMPMLPGDSSCAALITSRCDLSALVVSCGVILLTLDTLAEAEARELLTRHIGQRRAEAAAQVVDELVGACSGLPVALSAVAAKAASRPHVPLAALAAELMQAAATGL